MDIETLKRKRKKSVQDQNAISKHQILTAVQWWANGNKLPKLIESMAEKEGISRRSAILVEATSGPVCCEHSYSGCFLSNNREFWSYNLDLNADETEIEHLKHWGKVDIEVNQYQKGTGKSFGFLCIEILNEIEN